MCSDELLSLFSFAPVSVPTEPVPHKTNPRTMWLLFYFWATHLLSRL
jgi:hypothetical protein